MGRGSYPESLNEIKLWEHVQKCVTDGRTDGQTDGQTDRRTDGRTSQTVHRAALKLAANIVEKLRKKMFSSYEVMDQPWHDYIGPKKRF